MVVLAGEVFALDLDEVAHRGVEAPQRRICLEDAGKLVFANPEFLEHRRLLLSAEQNMLGDQLVGYLFG